MTHLVRKPRASSSEIKVSIYEKLSDHGLRFDELARASRRDRMTLTKYLAHGIEEGEVSHDLTTKQYRVLPKGVQQLHRVQDERRRREAAFRYSGSLYPMRHPASHLSPVFLPPQEIDPARLAFYTHLALSHLPLIMPFQASLYGSEKLQSVFESAEDTALDALKEIIKPEKVRERILSETLQGLGEQLFWALVTRRLSFLLEWHDYYRKGIPAMPHRPKPGRAMRSAERQAYHAFSKPPPLTIENILRFDASATLDFRGEAAFHQLPKKLRQLVGKRLVGSMLLRLAYGDPTLKMHGAVVAQQFAESGLLKKEDASVLQKLTEQANSRNTALNTQESQAIYDMAFRYFEEADRLAGPTPRPPKTSENPWMSFAIPSFAIPS